MIAVIRIAPFWLFYYWEKPVMNRLGRSSQNGSFIAVISSQERSSLASGSYRHWHRNKNSRLITGGYTSKIILIPIVFQHTGIPCLRLPVDPHAILSGPSYVGRHLTTLNHSGLWMK